jgi:hypothetical protein
MPVKHLTALLLQLFVNRVACAVVIALHTHRNIVLPQNRIISHLLLLIIITKNGAVWLLFACFLFCCFVAC